MFLSGDLILLTSWKPKHDKPKNTKDVFEKYFSEFFLSNV